MYRDVNAYKSVHCLNCRLIRDSAPLINIIIVCGCILMLATSFLLGIDSKTPDANTTMTPNVNLTSQDMYANERFGIICNVSLSVKVAVSMRSIRK